jgi:hypothetical protein
MTIRTTRQAETLRDTRAQAEGTGQENDTSALLVDATARPKPRSEARHRVEGRTSWESHKTHTPPHQHQTQQANRSIFGTRQTSYRALQHPVTRVITDDATQMLGIIDKHYRDLGKPPSGEHTARTRRGKPCGTNGGKQGRRPP